MNISKSILLALGMLILQNASAQLQFIPQQKKLSGLENHSSDNEKEQTTESISALQIGPSRSDTIKTLDSLSHRFVDTTLLSDTQKEKTANLLLMSLSDARMSNIRFRDSLLASYKELRHRTPYRDTDRLKRLDTAIRLVKNYTTGEFLTGYKPPKMFSIHRAYRYNLDSLNRYAYAQNDIGVLQYVDIQSTGDKSYVSAELFALLFGPLRLGIGGSFGSTEDSTRDNAIKTNLQKIMSNAGAVNLSLAIPVVYYRTKKDRFHFSVYGQIKTSVNPAIRDSTAKPDFTSFYTINQTGFNIHADITSNDRMGIFFIDLPFYYSFATTNTYQQLSIADFSVLKIRLGLNIKNKIGLNITGPLWSSTDVMQAVPFTIGFDLSPTQIINAD